MSGLETYIEGKSFIDVGGLWNTVNEKVTVAAKAGAVRTAMLDVMPAGNHLWKMFDERCAEAGVVCDDCISGDINEPSIVERVGIYDVVHCSGVLYHCPNPVFTFNQLRKITRETLIFASIGIPSTISNAKGSIHMEEGSCLFVPALSELQKSVLTEHFSGIEMGGINFDFGGENYAPWWYLFTGGFIEALHRLFGLDILEKNLSEDRRLIYIVSRCTGASVPPNTRHVAE